MAAAIIPPEEHGMLEFRAGVVNAQNEDVVRDHRSAPEPVCILRCAECVEAKCAVIGLPVADAGR